MKFYSPIVYLFTLGADLLGAVFVLVLGLFGASNYRFERPPKRAGLWALTCEVDSLFGYAAMTIAPHVIIYRKGRRLPQGWSVLQDHEHRHCEQYEAYGLGGVVFSVAGLFFHCNIFMSLAEWILAPWVIMLTGFVVAVLRGEPLYRGSHNEEAAYALSADDEV